MAIAQGVVPEAIAELQEFIALRPDAREVRKALAVKLVYQGYKYLGNSNNFRCVTGFDNRLEALAVEEYGIDGLRLNHKGRKSHSLCRTARRSIELVANTRIAGNLAS